MSSKLEISSVERATKSKTKTSPIRRKVAPSPNLVRAKSTRVHPDDIENESHPVRRKGKSKRARGVKVNSRNNQRSVSRTRAGRSTTSRGKDSEQGGKKRQPNKKTLSIIDGNVPEEDDFIAWYLSILTCNPGAGPKRIKEYTNSEEEKKLRQRASRQGQRASRHEQRASRQEQRQCKRQVHFSNELVSEVRERPRTGPEEWRKLHYTPLELQRFWDDYDDNASQDHDRNDNGDFVI